LTLTPALSAIILKPAHESHNPAFLQKFFDAFNKVYLKVEGAYKKLVERIGTKAVVTIGILTVSVLAAWGITFFLPSGFIPTEDQGIIYVNVNSPKGATLERTSKVLDEITRISKTLGAVENVSSLGGYSLITESAGSSYGMAMLNLKPWEERTESVDELIDTLNRRTRHITDAAIEFFPPPTVPGFGNASGFELRLIDKSGSGSLVRINDVGKKFIADLKARPEIASAFTNFDPSFPQYMIHIDYEMAAKNDVSVASAMNELQTLIGSYYASNFVRFGQMYKVMIQASPEYRTKPEDLRKLFIKNERGQLVQYSMFMTIDRVYGPEQITRYNMFNAIMINGIPAKGHSSGDAIRVVQEISKSLPRGFAIEFSGITREEILSGNQAIFIFIICLVFVYLLLAAQYESFILPLPVLLALPTGIFGAFFALTVLGLENNIYAQVSLVMLIGLLGKNAILIVEFAIAKQREGVSIKDAMIEGAVSRLRPILMTSFAFNAGLIPLVIASGPGELGNRSIGTAAAGGMLIGTIFGVIIIPGLYFLFAGLEQRLRKRPLPASTETKSA
jgi:HAE1 family hydrophobic/amphiphilic exporter-1